MPALTVPALIGPPSLATVLAALVVALLVGLVWTPTMRHLPEPAPVEPPAEDGEPAKVPYGTLGRDHAIAAAVSAGVGTGVACWLAPTGSLPAWVGLATVGVILAVVDLRTTWLPLRLTHALWALTTLGVLALPLTAGVGAAVSACVAAIATGIFFWAFWRVGGGLGFGDVRLAPVVGAVAGSVSPSHAFAAVLLGTLLGALHGVAHRVIRGRDPFPYGPSLVAGPWLALVALSALG